MVAALHKNVWLRPAEIIYVHEREKWGLRKHIDCDFSRILSVVYKEFMHINSFFSTCSLVSHKRWEIRFFKLYYTYIESIRKFFELSPANRSQALLFPGLLSSALRFWKAYFLLLKKTKQIKLQKY